MYSLAIDLGASSGRHILGRLQNGQVHTEEIYRFPNVIIRQNGHDCWDVDALFHHIVEGMKRCGELGCAPSTVGIDTWGVDYVLVDETGKRLGDAVCYRDRRTEGMPEALESALPFALHYQKTGTARQAYNTVYQLAAHRLHAPEQVSAAHRLLFLPCYFSYLLCGRMRNEYTIASTSGMLNARTRDWDKDVLAALQIDASLLGGAPALPGTVLGPLLPDVRRQVGYDCRVVLTAAHDTAAAFYALPQSDRNTVFLSSGTWSLLGATLDAPLTHQDALRSGFTNEGGVNGVRFLKNIMGLWILQEIRREWRERLSFADMAALAQTAAHYEAVFDVTDERFLKPASMTRAVRQALDAQGAPNPDDAELLYAVHHSLARSYQKAVRSLEKLLNIPFRRLIVLGGGSQNALLNRLTEQMTGLPVILGPAEGSALGNLNVQFLARSADA